MNPVYIVFAAIILLAAFLKYLEQRTKRRREEALHEELLGFVAKDLDTEEEDEAEELGNGLKQSCPEEEPQGNILPQASSIDSINREQSEQRMSEASNLPSPDFVNELGHIDFDAFDESVPPEKQKTYNTGKYLGDFNEKGQRHGLGKYYFSQSTYLGYWQEGKRMGFGILKWHTGSAYYGNWVTDNMQGKGHFQFYQGDKYYGEYLNDMRHGVGIYYFRNGDCYVGDFVKNQRTGIGRYIYASGIVYEGGYFESKAHGQGRIIHPTGKVQEGYWNMGMLTTDKKI